MTGSYSTPMDAMGLLGLCDDIIWSEHINVGLGWMLLFAILFFKGSVLRRNEQ